MVMAQQFIVTKRQSDFINSFEFTLTVPDKTPGDTIAYSQQRRFANEDQAVLYTNEVKSSPLCILSRQNDTTAQIVDPYGYPINHVKAAHPTATTAGEWIILDQQHSPIVTVRPRNTYISSILHLIKPMPVLASWVRFIAIASGHRLVILNRKGHEIGSYTQVKLFRPMYRLSVDDTSEIPDWRAFASLCLILDL
ncbi:TPA: hypothetical protein DDX46_01260 [Candidatus Saccharibacteria bacterium]|nr:MAG: hypothetical protein UW38_C0001G0069 [Candidatus Saccharibacteria bacterium GW2011_GWC2_44_17]OGL33018.1 MAG: hypothetical protein A3E20_00720 [Candidatus Saccharibacteria bacterium RIFCSPHIGHO2_12_FULL_47_16]HBH77357.1 hypothetical protein [Candidatus Saccharibacteria bacterium]